MGDRADFFTVWCNTHFLNITLLHIEIGISYAASIHFRLLCMVSTCSINTAQIRNIRGRNKS